MATLTAPYGTEQTKLATPSPALLAKLSPLSFSAAQATGARQIDRATITATIRSAKRFMSFLLIVLCTQTPFSSLYTIFAADSRQPHLTPSASTASLGIGSLPFRSYFASERKTSALTARRLAGETVASARRRDGPLFIESQNSSGLLKIHSAVMRSLRTQRKPAASSARSIAP